MAHRYEFCVSCGSYVFMGTFRSNSMEPPGYLKKKRPVLCTRCKQQSDQDDGDGEE